MQHRGCCWLWQCFLHIPLPLQMKVNLLCSLCVHSLSLFRQQYFGLTGLSLCYSFLFMSLSYPLLALEVIRRSLTPPSLHMSESVPNCAVPPLVYALFILVVHALRYQLWNNSKYCVIHNSKFLYYNWFVPFNPIMSIKLHLNFLFVTTQYDFCMFLPKWCRMSIWVTNEC